MPLPIAHSLAGYALSEMQTQPFFDKKWKTILLFVVLANAADFDFLPGFLLNDPNRFHHGWSHTLGASVIAGFLGAFWFRKKLPFWKGFWILGGVYFSHIALDFFSSDGRPPYGVMLLWPFTDTFYIADSPLFKNIQRSNDPSTFFQSLFSAHNLGGALREFCIMGGVCALVKCFSFFRRKNPPNQIQR